RGPQRGPHADERAAGDVAGLAAHGLAEAPEHRQRAHHHLRRLRRGIELADDADRAPGTARGQRVALQHEDVADAEAGQVERDRGAGDAAPDDDDAGGTTHDEAANPRRVLRTSPASSSLTT